MDDFAQASMRAGLADRELPYLVGTWSGRRADQSLTWQDIVVSRSTK